MKKKLLIILSSVIAMVLTGCSLGGPNVAEIELDQKEFMEIMKKEGYEVESITSSLREFEETFKEVGVEMAVAAKENTQNKEQGVVSTAMYIEVEDIKDAWFVYKTLTIGGEAVDLFGSHAKENKLDVSYRFDDTHDKESGLCNLVVDGEVEVQKGDMEAVVGYINVIWKEDKMLIMASGAQDQSMAQEEMEVMCEELEMEDYLFDFEI